YVPFLTLLSGIILRRIMLPSGMAVLFRDGIIAKPNEVSQIPFRFLPGQNLLGWEFSIWMIAI
ncbi:MAG: hypothetical protein ACLFQ6_13005, partial [Candidatus Sumerlaeia bacterium]